MPNGSIPMSCGSVLALNRTAALFCRRDPARNPEAIGIPVADDIVCHMSALYTLRRGRTVFGALHAQMDWPWKS
jgi:hypothetical protein